MADCPMCSLSAARVTLCSVSRASSATRRFRSTRFRFTCRPSFGVAGSPARLCTRLSRVYVGSARTPDVPLKRCLVGLWRYSWAYDDQGSGRHRLGLRIPNRAARHRRSAARGRILLVLDSGYDTPRIAHLPAGLQVEVVVHLRSHRVMRSPTPPRVYGPKGGRPPRHGGEFVFG
ncbi:transposase [Streptomyces mirabilis]|uniref:transposase n=1 Tax=Streptomyces mirabilis TaxID=68239 RepID=UPI0036A25908